jgi:hypothetical protein
MGGQWDVPDWEEPEATWTLMDEARRRYALVRILTAPLTAVRLRSRVLTGSR